MTRVFANSFANRYISQTLSSMIISELLVHRAANPQGETICTIFTFQASRVRKDDGSAVLRSGINKCVHHPQTGGRGMYALSCWGTQTCPSSSSLRPLSHSDAQRPTPHRQGHLRTPQGIITWLAAAYSRFVAKSDQATSFQHRPIQLISI